LKLEKVSEGGREEDEEKLGIRVYDPGYQVSSVEARREGEGGREEKTGCMS